jgi:amidase
MFFPMRRMNPEGVHLHKHAILCRSNHPRLSVQGAAVNTQWLYLSAAQLVQALRTGDISSRALLEAYIQQIEAKNPQINAVVATDFEAARQRADAADQALLRGHIWGPLHGLPLTIKDTYEVPGMPCTAGAPMLRHHHPPKPAVAVQRLLDAGAIVLGKTNVPLFASDLQSYNKVYGTTCNPWNPQLTPGGSSGGAAAALAAGFTALELGSDIGGSIRIPAHFCGVYGHKTTYGVISLRGHIPGPPGTLGEPDLAVAGPMARTAQDLSLMLDVLAGPSPSIAGGWQIQLPVTTKTRLSEFRVLMWLDDPLCPIDAQMTAMYQQLQSTLQAQGVQVTVGAPLGMNILDFYPTYLNLLGSVTGASQNRFVRYAMGLFAPVMAVIGKYVGAPKFFENYLEGVAQSHADWIRVHEKRLRLIENFKPVFETYDVVLMPATATTAFKHLHKPELPMRKLVINGEKRGYTELFMWIAPATVMGLPATSAPIGCTSQGVPVNVQILGAAFQDKTTLKFAELLAPVMGGFVPPPGY